MTDKQLFLIVAAAVIVVFIVCAAAVEIWGKRGDDE